MKRIALLILMITISVGMFAQVPEKVQVTFKEKYPDVTMVNWLHAPNGYKVSFVDKDQVQNMVIFSADGKIVRREMEVTKDYPQAIVEYYTKTYTDEKEKHIWLVTDENGNKTYYIKRADKIIYFDKEGKFAREEKPEIIKGNEDDH